MKKFAILISITCSLSAMAQSSSTCPTSGPFSYHCTTGQAPKPQVKCVKEAYNSCPTTGPFSYHCSNTVLYRIVCTTTVPSQAFSAAEVQKEISENLTSRFGY